MAQVTLTSPFSEDIDQFGVEYPNDGGDFLGCNASADGRVFRVAIRFTPVGSLSGTDTITAVELIVNCDFATGVGSESWYIGPYNTNGQGDPQADAGATAYSRSNVSGGNYGTFTDFRTTGVKTITLGGSVTTHLEAAVDAASVFSVALQQVNETPGASQRGVNIKEYVDGTDPPKLRVTYTAAAGTALKDVILCAGGIVPWAR